jgi:hypothetical protein
MVLRVLEAEVCGPHSLRLVFNNGVRKRVNVWPLLDGPIFEPLRDPTYFARATLDAVAGTVVWPNEADFAPEALYELDAERELDEAGDASPTPELIGRDETGRRFIGVSQERMEAIDLPCPVTS